MGGVRVFCVVVGCIIACAVCVDCVADSESSAGGDLLVLVEVVEGVDEGVEGGVGAALMQMLLLWLLLLLRLVQVYESLCNLFKRFEDCWVNLFESIFA